MSYLILERRVGEKIVIGSDPPVIVEVVEIRGGRVTIAVNAPREVPVHREEVNESIKRIGSRRFDLKVVRDAA